MPDLDLEIRGGSHPEPLIRGGGGLQKKFFWPFGPQFGLKIGGDPAPLGPSPGSTTRWSSCVQCTTLNRTMESTTGRIQPSRHSEQIFPSLYMAAVIN